MTEDYEYTGMIAEYWDLLRGDTSGWASRPYFLQVIRESGEPALDVACGTGRLLLDYRAEGLDIDGIDISPEMIALCRQNAAELGLNPGLYVGSMAAMDLPRRYQTIIVPSSSFLQITAPQAAHQALVNFKRHLLPGGLLCMSLRVLEPESADAEAEFEVLAEATRPSDGALVRRWWRATYDLPNRLQHTEDRYEIIVDGQIVQTETHRRSPALTWCYPSEALEMLQEAGFVEVQAQADFTRDPASDADLSYTVLGKNP